MFFRTLTTLAVVVLAMPAIAQPRTPQEAMRIAEESRMCGDLKVLRAEWRRHGNIGVLCEGGAAAPADVGEATNFVPLLGGLGGLVGIGGGAVVVGVLVGGSSSSDTQ
ncbi:hypothetical protein [Thalassovita sp.]|jgi:hypothetical protein|uniref:hypothetical protein n=1 Tax=Thalassovita sp. TaxID=1979401 RepID=UPI003B5B27C9